MSLRGSNQTAWASCARPCAARLHGRVVLAGDDVRVRHDQRRRPRPSPSPRCRGRRPCRARARCCGRPRCTSRVARDARRSGAGTSAIGPSTCGNGSKRASAFRKPPDGGRCSLSVAEDLRALDVARAARARPASAARRRRTATRCPARRPPAAPRRRRCRGPRAARPAGRAAGSRATRAPSPGAAEDDRAEQREQRRVGRLRARRRGAAARARAPMTAPGDEARPATARRRSAPARTPRAPSQRRRRR